MAKTTNEKYKEAVMGAIASKNAVNTLNESLTLERTKAIKVRRWQDEMLLSRAREELITRDLVTAQATYLLVSLRQRILSLPHTYARRLAGIDDVRQVQAILKEMSLSLLREIKDLPERVVDPQWVEDLDGE